MKDPSRLAEIYRAALERAKRSKRITDPNVMALLAVYDEGWADGFARLTSE